MFDIGFPELMIVSVVALLVLGPERLPVALRTLGLWFGRMRRSFSAVKVEIEREIGMDEVRRQLHNEAILDQMRSLETEVNSIGKEVTEHATEAIDATANDITASKPTASNITPSDTTSGDTTASDLEAAMSDLERAQLELETAQSDLQTAQRDVATAQGDLQTTPSAWQPQDNGEPHFEEGEAELEEPRDFDSDDFEYSNEPHPNDNRGN